MTASGNCRRCPCTVKVWQPDRHFHAFLHHTAGLLTPLAGHLELSGDGPGRAAAADATARMRLLQTLAEPGGPQTEKDPAGRAAAMLEEAGYAVDRAADTISLRIPHLPHHDLARLSMPWQHRSIGIPVPAAIRIIHHAGGAVRASCEGVLTLAL